MHLLNLNFYNIKSQHIEGTTAKYNISFNCEHPIYAAHFPEHPITPGAATVQVCKELTESMISQSLFLKTMKNVKFLKIITPNEADDVNISLTVIKNESEYKVNALVSGENETVFAKLSLIFQQINL